MKCTGDLSSRRALQKAAVRYAKTRVLLHCGATYLKVTKRSNETNGKQGTYMTYQTHTAPTSLTGASKGFFASIGHFFVSIAQSIEANSMAQRRLDAVHRLQRRTDVELDAIGIKREDIVHHVFKDLYYI